MPWGLFRGPNRTYDAQAKEQTHDRNLEPVERAETRMVNGRSQQVPARIYYNLDWGFGLKQYYETRKRQPIPGGDPKALDDKYARVIWRDGDPTKGTAEVVGALADWDTGIVVFHTIDEMTGEVPPPVPGDITIVALEFATNPATGKSYFRGYPVRPMALANLLPIGYFREEVDDIIKEFGDDPDRLKAEVEQWLGGLLVKKNGSSSNGD